MTRCELVAGVLGVCAALVIVALVPDSPDSPLTARPKPPPEWAVATWRVEEILGRPAIDKNVTLSITPEGFYSVSHGCNHEGGVVLFSGENIRFNGWRTLKACLDNQPRSDQESRYENATGGSHRARVESSGQLLLLSETGEVLVRYSRIGDAPPWGKTR